MSNERDDFIRLIAHDLRTPLGVMQLNAQLIERLAAQDGRGKELRWAGSIASSARKMDRMIQLLVEAERIRSARAPLVRERISFAAWLEQRSASWVVGQDGSRPNVIVKDRSAMVSVDPGRLQKAMLALLEVARQSMDAGASISIEAGRRECEVVCAIRGPKPGADSQDTTHLASGHEIEIHYVQAVLAAHGGALRVALGDEAEVGFDVILPALTSDCT